MARRGISGFFIGALLFMAIGHTRAQTPDSALRSWSCLSSSVAAGSSFPQPVTNAACSAAPPVRWPFGRSADVVAPPGLPTGLRSTVSGQTVTLTWNAPNGGGAPDFYVLQAGSSSGQSNLANANTGSTATTLTVTNVPPGAYFVRVLAQNASGASAPSNEIVVTVGGGGGCNSAPGAPTGLVASANGSNVTLAWQAPGAGCAPTTYIVQAGSSPGASNLANFSTGSAATSYSAGGVGAGVYYVRVLAANAAGTSGPSPDAQLVVGGGGCSGPPGASPGLSVSVTGSTVTFTWLAAPGSPTTYILGAGTSSGSSNIGSINAGNTTSYTATGVPAGTYYVRVQAANLCGTGPVSNEVVATVGGSGGPGPGAPTLTPLHGFTGSPNDGSNWSTVTQGSDGNFYGTAATGGPFNPACSTNLTGCGLLFKMTPSGALTVLYTFTGTTADHNALPIYPYAALLQASDGNFYGTTAAAGSVFRMTPSGNVTHLTYLGGGSSGKLIQASDGNLYGTTAFGGAGTCSEDRAATCKRAEGSGTVFRVSTGGALATLHVFTGGADGSQPYSGVIQGSDGNLYGVAQNGGAGFGTVFRVGLDGSFATLHTFSGGADGASPYAQLVQGSDGNLYGSTVFGASANAGTVFRIAPSGAFTTLHTFTGFSVPDEAPRPGVALDGAYPAAPLVQAPDGSIIGVTGGGGPRSGGTAFKITPSGAYSQVAIFAGNAEGSSPIWLIRGNDGNYYGNCQYGGVRNMGAIFRMSPP
jgi:uncharacterized repeat protein (TIGR03803 family)